MCCHTMCLEKSSASTPQGRSVTDAELLFPMVPSTVEMQLDFFGTCLQLRGSPHNPSHSPVIPSFLALLSPRCAISTLGKSFQLWFRVVILPYHVLTKVQ